MRTRLMYLSYPERREDGWPLCPSCGEDELWSANIPADPSQIASCLSCGWMPPFEPEIAAAARRAFGLG